MIFIPLLFAFCFYLLAYGWRTLDPAHFAWLQQRDSSGHLLGWLYYLGDEWRFPLGKVGNLMAPIGTSTISTDSIPLVSLLVKFVFGGISQHFQYFGAWLLFCYLMQAFWAYRLLLLQRCQPAFAALGSFFFVMSPALLFRSDHKSLCAQWILLWLFYLYGRAAETKRAPYPSLWLANVLSVGFHAYLFPMVFGLSVAVYFRAQEGRPRAAVMGRQLAELFSIFASVLFAMYALGYFLVTSPASWGFGLFSADLLSFFNSMGKPTLLPKLRSGGSQHEGFSYLGLGMILLLLFALALGRGKKTKPIRVMSGTRPLLLMCGMFFFFALSSHITFGGNPIVKIEWFYKLFGSIPNIFRSSGRFVWPLYYLLMLWVLVRVGRLWPGRGALAVLGLALLVQFADLRVWYLDRAERGALLTEESRRLASPFWGEMKKQGINQLLLGPPFLLGEGQSCGATDLSITDFRALAYAAIGNGWSINGGSGARVPAEQLVSHCQGFWPGLESDGLGRALLVMARESKDWPLAEKILRAQPKSFRCELIDGFRACYLLSPEA
jgi:hypothetical protein